MHNAGVQKLNMFGAEFYLGIPRQHGKLLVSSVMTSAMGPDMARRWHGSRSRICRPVSPQLLPDSLHMGMMGGRDRRCRGNLQHFEELTNAYILSFPTVHGLQTG